MAPTLDFRGHSLGHGAQHWGHAPDEPHPVVAVNAGTDASSCGLTDGTAVG